MLCAIYSIRDWLASVSYVFPVKTIQKTAVPSFGEFRRDLRILAGQRAQFRFVLSTYLAENGEYAFLFLL